MAKAFTTNTAQTERLGASCVRAFPGLAGQNPWRHFDFQTVREHGVKTARPAGVAGRTFLFNQKQKAVAIAIDAHLDKPLPMA